MRDERGIELRIKAERIIRADRSAVGRDASHLIFEQQYKAAMQAYLAALTRINRMLDFAFPK
jgi:hypothetical protein